MSPSQKINTKEKKEENTRPLVLSQGGRRSLIIGEGEMADLVRAFDWNKTPLGPPETWSEILVTTVNLLLASRHPMFLWWGPGLIQFYNDGYRPSLGADKHPAAVGQRGIECWPEIWHIIGSQIEGVMNRGDSTWNTNQLVPINRNGSLEEIYWTYSYSPVRDKDGKVQGTLVVCSETTEQVLSERRLRTLLALGPDSLNTDSLGKDSPGKDSPGKDNDKNQAPASQPLLPFAQSIVSSLDAAAADAPFAGLYLLTEKGIIPAGNTSADRLLLDPQNWPLTEVANAQTPRVLEDLQPRFGELIYKPWPEPVTRAYVLPLPIAGSSIQAVMVFGISPRLPFDDRYRTFFQLVGTRIASLMQSEVYVLELAQAAQRFRSLAEADPFGMVIGDLRGGLTYVNPAFLRVLGYTQAEVAAGKLRWDALTPPEHAAADAIAIEQLTATGRCEVYEKEYLTKDGRRIPILIGASLLKGSGSDSEVAAFLTNLTPLKAAQQALHKANERLEKKVAERTAELETEVAERKRAEISLRELTVRLLRTQDEERRHMARELHDHAGQTLVALSMNLSALQAAAATSPPQVLTLAAESQQLSEDLSKEIRTLSYLLHPPLLDEAGLSSAIRWYVEGFSRRSNIQVQLELPFDFGRLPTELEMVIFRIVQECLTNIHRHSGSSSAEIYFRRSDRAVEFEISDRGQGISPQKQKEMTAAGRAGVGLRGMEERVRQFEGTLQIVSTSEGTTVAVMFPLQSAAA